MKIVTAGRAQIDEVRKTLRSPSESRSEEVLLSKLALLIVIAAISEDRPGAESGGEQVKLFMDSL